MSLTAQDWGWLALFAPLGVAVVCALCPPIRQRGTPAAWLSVAGALVSLVASATLFRYLYDGGRARGESWVVEWLISDGARPIELGIHIDAISVTMLLVVALVALCVQVFSLGYMHDEPPNDYGRYFTWQSFFLFTMNALVLAPNLLQLFVGWELVGLCSYLLIGFYYRKPSAARAALKAFWVTKFADMGLLVGLVVLWAETGSFAWTGVEASVAGVVSLLFFVAVMGKSAQFPLHIWLPDAMEGPTPVSALLHAATMVAAGVYLLVRSHPLYDAAVSPLTADVLTYVGAFTALFASCVALVQDDIKKVLAYSTCAQLGYMVCGAGVGGFLVPFLHLGAHAFFKALLFLCAGSMIHAVHTNDIKQMGGLLSKMRVTGITFILGAAALAGIPGSSGFFSKELIIDAALEETPIVGGALYLGAFLTALYMGRVVLIALFGKPRSLAAEHARESGWSMTLPLIVLAVPTVVLGYWFAPISAMLGVDGLAFHWGFVALMGSAVALSGVVAAWVIFGGERVPAMLAPFASAGRIARSGAVDRLMLSAYRDFLGLLSTLVGWIDRYIVDGLINATGYLILELGARLRLVQTGNVQHYLFAVSVGLLLVAAYSVLGVAP